MNIKFTPEMTREFILSRVTEEEVFEKYGVRVQQGMIRSPLRLDRHPTCRFFRARNGRLVLHDFSGHFHGDCFDFVGRVKGGLKFYDALRDVAKEFKIIDGSPRTPIVSSTVIGPKALCELRIKAMPWDERHLAYWDQYGITPETLSLYKVKQLSHAWLNGSIFYNREFARKHEIVMAYDFNNYDYKLYMPERETGRFIHNNPDILQGYDQLPAEGEYVVITKALKDVMAFHEFGIASLAPMSETTTVSDDVLDILKKRFKKVYALFDRDTAGILGLRNMKRRGVTPLLIPKALGVKDFSDVCKKDLLIAKHLTIELFT